MKISAFQHSKLIFLDSVFSISRLSFWVSLNKPAYCLQSIISSDFKIYKMLSMWIVIIDF